MELSKSKKRNQQSLFNPQFYFAWLLGMLVIISTQTQAHTNNCPTGDPLQFSYIQNLIANSDGCSVAEIQQFDFN